MEFKGINDKELCESNNFAKDIFNMDTGHIGVFDRKLLYFAIIDFHQFIYQNDIFLDDVINWLNRYESIINIHFNDDCDDKAARAFWQLILTKDKRGYDCSASDFIYYMKRVHTDCNIIRFLEKKVRIYFKELKDVIVKNYNFVVIHTNDISRVNKSVIRFGSNSPEKEILHAAETLESYDKGHPVGSYMRNVMKQNGCHMVNCMARDSVKLVKDENDLARLCKAANEPSSETLLSLLGDNDEFYGVVDCNDEFSQFVNIISISRVNAQYVGATIIRQLNTEEGPLYSVDVAAIHDGQYNVCWHDNRNDAVLIPGSDAEKVIRFLLFSDDEDIF